MPEAMPRRRTSNQADMRATDGTSTVPAPTPVRNRPPDAATMPSEMPVMNMPSAATIEPAVTTTRGPNRDARIPPTAALST